MRLRPEDREYLDVLQSIRSTMAPEMVEKLRQVHDNRGFLCVAHDEGLNCCIDYLLGDV